MYEATLSEIHDRWFSEHAHKAADVIRSKFPSGVSSIADLGCGSGTLLSHFHPDTNIGYGSDISPNMIALAERKCPNFQFEVNGLFHTRIPPSQVVTAVGEIVSYAAYQTSNLENSLESLFSTVFNNLSSDGLFLFDVLVKGFNFSYSSFFDKEDLTIFMKSTQKGTEVKREILSFLKKDTSYEKSREEHHLVIFDTDYLKSLINTAGFKVNVLDHYLDYELPPGRKAFLCTK